MAYPKDLPVHVLRQFLECGYQFEGDLRFAGRQSPSEKMVSLSDVARYAAANPETTKLLESGKLQFTKTGQEFPSTASQAILNAYATGRAYRRAIESRANEAYDFSQHQPHIVPHKHRDENHFLYCTLTSSTLPKTKDVVEKHVSGKRFLRRLKEFEQAKKKREELEQARKEKRERAKRKDKSGSGKNTQDGEGEDKPDVLAGVLSESESDEDGEPSEESDEEAQMVDVEQAKNTDEAEDEEEESAFWTRGRSQVVGMDDDDENVDDDDEWEEKPRKAARQTPVRPNAGKKSKRPPVRRSERPIANKIEKEKGAATSIAEDDDAASGVKRNRSEKKVNKKSRRPRRRRKSGSSGVEP